MSASSLRDGLMSCVDSALSVRDKTGAKLHDVFVVTRTWSGEDIGDGQSSETEIQVLPTPEIVDYSMDIRLQTGGSIRQGDLILKSISCNKFSAVDLHTQTEQDNVEKFYKINNEFYDVIRIRERFITFEVHIRKTNERDIRNQ